MQLQRQHRPARVVEEVDQHAVQLAGPEVEPEVELVAQFDGVGCGEAQEEGEVGARRGSLGVTVAGRRAWRVSYLIIYTID